jgi:hypothetical protein
VKRTTAANFDRQANAGGWVPRGSFGKLRAAFQLTAKVQGHKPLYLRLLDRAGNVGVSRKLHFGGAFR